MTRSGAAAASLPECKYLEVMHLLHDKISNLPTHSKVDHQLKKTPVNASKEKLQLNKVIPPTLF